MSKLLGFVAAMPLALFAAQPSREYIVDYWAPPTDMVPAEPIQKYTLNTRVSCYRWIEYEGANALALNISRIDEQKIRREIETSLIQTNRNPKALQFDLADEKIAAKRQVGIYGLKLDAQEFTGVAFKVRAKAANASNVLNFEASGHRFAVRFSTETKPGKELTVTPAKDGFVDYRFNFKAGDGARIERLIFTAGEASAADFTQDYEIIDFRLIRPAPKARFQDLPPRSWVKRDSALMIEDIYDYVRNGLGVDDSRPALPGVYELRPQLEKEKDGGFKVEFTEVEREGAKLPAVKITLEKGPRCLLRFPVAFDGLDYNLFTFLGKIEVYPGAKPLLKDTKPMLWGANQFSMNAPVDTFQINFFAKNHEFYDWTRGGIAVADWTQNKQLECRASQNAEGYRVFAYDLASSDPSNNKNTYLPKITHWCFYYDNRKIPEGQKVVVTIADPRITRGVHLTGGDEAKYAEFLQRHDPAKQIDFGALDTALEPPREHRLSKPIRFIEDGRALGAIYLGQASFPPGTSREGAAAYFGIVEDAAKEFATVLERKYSLAQDVKIHRKLPGDWRKSVTNSIIVGDAYRSVNQAQFDADMKTLAGKNGCAIRSDGTNIYIYAAQYNYAGNVRGMAFGLYELLENNLDLIYPFNDYRNRASPWSPVSPVRRFEPAEERTLDLVWGDGFVHVSQFPEYNLFGVGGRNRVPGYEWAGSWDFARQRTRSINHWWGYGTEPRGDEKRNEPNDTWGRDADGKFMVPGCYTGHPCLIRVLDRARDSYLESSAFATLRSGCFVNTQAPGQAFAWNSYDLHGLWVEDSISMCQCEKCLTPIRLADGSTVGPDSPAFRSTQFYSNGSAMINAVNVYGNRNARIESIGYMWMAPVPLMTVSRNYNIRFCPYIRKNYFVPIFAPMNDMHYRAMYQWSQQEVRLSLYEYFLWVGLRPWADIAAWDMDCEAKLGFYDWHAEAGSLVFEDMERWTLERMLWGSMGRDVPRLRAYYLKRTYREAAEPMAKFYQLVYSFTEESMRFNAPLEFEDFQVVYRNAMRHRAKGLFAGTVAEELEGYLRQAEKCAKSRFTIEAVADFRKQWDKYKAEAVKSEADWTADCEKGANSDPIKVVGAPE